MKKALIVIFISIFIVNFSVGAYTKTGHPDITELTFKEKGKLLINMTSSELDKAFASTGRRCFWGWKHHFMNIYSEADYVGEVIFARVNRTSDPIKFDYSIKETDYIERSVKTTGSISGSFGSKIKQIDCKLQGSTGARSRKKPRTLRLRTIPFPSSSNPTPA